MKVPSSKTARERIAAEAAPCVWMSAGLVVYKLCDRQFDCERCPLDAALRGVAPESSKATPAPTHRPWGFPEDRRYSLSHVWVQRLDATHVRLGVDALASNLIGDVERVDLVRTGDRLQEGAAVTEVTAGGATFTVHTPLAGQIARANEALRSEPQLLARAPYEDGWLLELMVPESDGAAIDSLVPAREIEKHARLDVQHFQRQVAMQLLTSSAQVGATLPDGGERVTDVRQMLGAERYAKLVQDLLG